MKIVNMIVTVLTVMVTEVVTTTIMTGVTRFIMLVRGDRWEWL